jgi:threonine aldolase
MTKISFASDNSAGIHPDILSALEKANVGHVLAYGHDEYTQKAEQKFHEYFGEDSDVFFLMNGTGANVTSIAASIRSFQAVICSELAHIQSDECGAFENLTGSKLLLIPTTNGKLTVDKMKRYMLRVGDEHHVQPRIISISQSTEYGTVYTPTEIKMIADFAHQNDMLLHMDGARISNAAVALDLEFKAITKEVGVDFLSFGGTKNGLMLGEAVIFFNRELAKNFLYIRKQSMQLVSKMRFISAQFIALLSNDLWKANASHANKMAQLLAQSLAIFPQIKLTQKVEANAIFAILPKEIINKLQEKFLFYVWDETLSEVRLMTSFNTKENEISEFIHYLTQIMKSL